MTAVDQALVYSGYVSGFAISDGADGPRMPVSWNEIDAQRWLHIEVSADLPSTVVALQGRCSEVSSGADAPPEFALAPGRRVSEGNFEFLVTHYALKQGASYVLRVSDDFAAKVARFVIAHGIRTLG